VTSLREGLFVSHLARLPVYAPNGDLIGRISDVVIARAGNAAPPIVLGLVVSVQRRPIFVSMNRVTQLDAAGATLVSGAVNLRRFARRPGETLVLGELLDSKVRDRESGRELRINDVAISQGRGREGWTVALLDLVERHNPLVPLRRARHVRLSWDQVTGLEAGESAESRLAALANLRPADLAAALQALPASAQRQFVAGLDDDRLANTLEELDEDVQARLLGNLDDERAADVLEAMEPDDAADLLGELSEADRARLLALMVPDEAEPVRRLLVYDDRTAGGLMNPEPVILPSQATVAEALARIRDADLSPPLAGQVFVVRPPTETPTGRFLGVAHFQRLLRERPGDNITAALDTDLDTLGPDLPIRRVAEYLASYNLLSAPVCDARGRLLGAVTVDDVLDHLLPESWRKQLDHVVDGGERGNGSVPDAGAGAGGGRESGAGEEVRR
jgi:MgtE intracellular N domain/CBS domain